MKKYIKTQHEGLKDLVACSICQKTVLRNNLPRHMEAHDENTAAHCELCNKDYSSIEHYRRHCKDFAYEHSCIKNGYSEFGAWPATMSFNVAFSEYSCALDERLSDDSDGRREEQLCKEMRALYTQQTPKYSSLYALLEVAAATEAKCDGTFSAFIKNIFYVGWSEITLSRAQKHQADKTSVCWLTPFLFALNFFSRWPNWRKCAQFGRRAAAST